MTTRRQRAPRRKIIGANWEAQNKPRGRPPAKRPRKATRIYLTQKQRENWLALTSGLSPLGSARIDVADLVMNYLEETMNEIQSGLTGADQVLPVGVVDLESLFFLLDLKPPTDSTSQYNITMYTETREKMSVITIRLQTAFRVTWSQVFGLGLELLYKRLVNRSGEMEMVEEVDDMEELKLRLFQPQQLQFSIR
jgi:hypothetical protein